jgi:hypothetical protein
MTTLEVVRRMARYAWASPNTVIGLCLGALVVASGGRASIVDGSIELHGGLLARGCASLPAPCRFDAITFGHVILAGSAAALGELRRHEQAHVRQYERWGVFFLPAYAASSAWQWLIGNRAHADNHFERSARAEAR